MPDDVGERLLEVFSDPPIKLYDHMPPDNINESNLVSGLIGRLRDQGTWARREVNLWEMIEVLYGRKRPDRIADHFGHILQPDIDILYCETEQGTRKSPLAATEIKHFAARTGDGSVMPKLGGGGGFYRGIGQALSLLLMGIDYVYLTHFFHFHPELWGGADDEQEELLAAHRKVTDTYADNIEQVIDTLNLPIGYIAAGTRPAADGIVAYPVNCITPNPNPFINTASAKRVRKLLADSFNVV